jgi:hypothetical protein
MVSTERPHAYFTSEGYKPLAWAIPLTEIDLIKKKLINHQDLSI